MYVILFSCRYIYLISQNLVYLSIADCILQFPIDLEQFDRREQLKKSGLGKVRIHHLMNTVRGWYLYMFWIW